jgi:hypothetical protein
MINPDALEAGPYPDHRFLLKRLFSAGRCRHSMQAPLKCVGERTSRMEASSIPTHVIVGEPGSYIYEMNFRLLFR